MRAPRASTKARTAGGRLRRYGPRGPLRGRSPLRGLRPPQTARPRPADPSASGTRTPLRGTRKSTKPMLWNHHDAPLPAAQGDAGFDEVCGGGAAQDGVSWLFVSGRRPVFVSRRRARSAGRSGRPDRRRRFGKQQSKRKSSDGRAMALTKFGRTCPAKRGCGNREGAVASLPCSRFATWMRTCSALTGFRTAGAGRKCATTSRRRGCASSNRSSARRRRNSRACSRIPP